VQFGTVTTKLLFKLRNFLALGLALTLLGTGCSRLLPPAKGTGHSAQLVLDTRRLPAEALSGCFIPAVFPAVTKLPVIMATPVPSNAVYKSATVETLSKNGDLQVLETVIENNQVYLKFAVPSVDSFTQYNVLVRVEYEYRR
jgi:hypothetical protein